MVIGSVIEMLIDSLHDVVRYHELDGGQQFGQFVYVPLN